MLLCKIALFDKTTFSPARTLPSARFFFFTQKIRPIKSSVFYTVFSFGFSLIRGQSYCGLCIILPPRQH